MSERQRRFAALALFVVTGALSAVTVVLHHQITGDPRLSNPTKPLDVGFLVSGTAIAVAGLLLAWARPYNAIGWLLGLAEFLAAFCDFCQHLGALLSFSGVPGAHLMLSLSAPLWIPALFIPATLVLARYPSGRIDGDWARRADRLVIVGFVALWLSYANADASVSDQIRGGRSPLPLPSWAGYGLGLVAAVAVLGGGLTILALTIRRLVLANGAERQQLAWLLTTSVLAILLVMLTPWNLLGSVAFAMVPVAVAIGVLRYNLLGIELVVRRTLLYGLLTAGVLAVFVAVTAGLAALLPTGPAPEVVAASLVAVGLVPARDRLQRLVDRFVYGDRGDPLAALARLSVPVGNVPDDELLAEVAGAVRDALRVPGVALVGADGQHVVVGDVPLDAPVVELRIGASVIGGLQVSPRSGERALTPSDRRLLDALAPMLAVVVHSVELSSALRREQQRSAEATQAERARLRRDLHDGLGPSLTGIGLGLEAVESATTTAQIPPRSREMLARLRAETSTALEDVRRIIDDLRPRVLETRSLVDSLREKAAHVTASTPLRVDVAASGALDCLTQETEAAALRIVEEALTNVVRHARATHCRIELSCTESGLDISIIDDGVGFSGLRDGGVGVPSMRARAESMGGQLDIAGGTTGTRVVARIPVGSAR